MEENNGIQRDENVETIIDVDSYDDTLLYDGYDNMSETSSQLDFTQYSVDDESLMIVEEDDNSDNNNEIIEVRKRLNESTSNRIPEQSKMEDNNGFEIEISDQRVPIKKKISTIEINPSKNINLSIKQNKTDSLNLERIAIPKLSMSNVRLNSSPVISTQVNKRPSISVVSTSSLIKPTTTTAKFYPKSSMTEVGYNKSFSKPVSTNESEIYVVPHNGLMKYMIRKVGSKTKLGSPNSSSSSTVKTQDTVIESVEQNRNINFTKPNVAQSGNTKKISKFVARMQKLPDGKYKMVPAQGKVPIGLEGLFKHNSHYIKQNIASSSTENNQKTSDFIHIESSSVNSRQLANSNETIYFQQSRQVLPSKSTWHKSIDIGNGNRDKKCIPHTITSKDAIENHTNVIQNGNAKIINNGNQDVVCTSTGFIQMPSKSESLIPLDGQSLNTNKYEKNSTNDHVVRVVSLESFNKSRSKMNSNFKGVNHSPTKMTKNDWTINNSKITDDTTKVFPSSIHASKDIKSSKAVREYSNRNKVVSKGVNYERIELSDDECDKSVQFVSCVYEFCDTLVYEPELIDGLYCSFTCKRLNSKVITEQECNKAKEPNRNKEPSRDEEPNRDEKLINIGNIKSKESLKPQKKPLIDRKQLLARLEKRINKRKQLLTSSHSEKMARNNDWDELDQFENFRAEPPSMDESHSSLNSPCRITTPEADDDNEDIIFDLKSMIKDKRMLDYMEDMQFQSAPKKLFDKPFPTEKNFFEVGHKLEGIDPEHEALFCVLTVIKVCGYRIKLHFDGFPSIHDFWVNADCPDLFYSGWCEQNSRIIQPPNNYENEFNWADYLNKNNALSAPKFCFTSTKNLTRSKSQHKFCIGNKLEALDKLTRTLPKQLICVATVADILGDRIRIHFDGWTEDFDYWTDITSTNIHPVRWCDNNGRSLSAPSGYNDLKGKKPFTWTEYLKETKSKPVPEDAFIRRPLRDFSIDMTIEVVDLVMPSLIRIAKVVDVKGDELKILYDGFNSAYAYWVEDDSPDIHPVGWSLKTEHPIEVPPVDSIWSCKIDGCCGKGNINGPNPNHVYAKDCPYELDAWKKSVAGLAKTPDRLKIDGVTIVTNSSTSQNTEHNDDNVKHKLNTLVPNHVVKNKGKQPPNNKSNEQQLAINSEQLGGTKNEQLGIKNEQLGIKNEQLGIKKEQFVKENELSGIKNIEPEDSNTEQIDHNAIIKNNLKIRTQIGMTLRPYDLNPLSLAQRGRAWTMHNAQIGIPVLNTSDARKWSVTEVASYVQQILSTKYSNTDEEEQNKIHERFKDQEIDGEAFLILTQEEIMKILKIPLGLAIKITSAIIMLRQRVPVFDYE